MRTAHSMKTKTRKVVRTKPQQENGNGVQQFMPAEKNGFLHTPTSRNGHGPFVYHVETGTELEGIRRDVFLDRYSLKDATGKPVERYPEEMWKRVAHAISLIEPKDKQEFWEQRFFHAMEGFKFVPAGRILSGSGTGYEVTFYNCFVIPSPKDSRDGIIDNLKMMVEIMARAGGVGINLSSLRPRGARVHKVNGTSSGPVNWAELYSVATHDVIQQGGSRRGALMLMLWDWHPDVAEFIEVKKDLSRINGANLSVCISDAFMEAVKKNKEWELVFPDNTDPEYDALWDGDLEMWKRRGKKVKVYQTVRARDLWEKICHAAHASAEPGLHFMERSNNWSPTYYYERFISTNPCGEKPLPAWGVCNLGSLNLAAFVTDGEMDYEALTEHAKIATRFLDNVVDANYYFYAENRARQDRTRDIGLGTMGLGDALLAMKVRYGAAESYPVIEKIYRTIRDAAYETSIELAREKGSFGAFEPKQYVQGHFIKQLPAHIRANIQKYGIRNGIILMQAPTGTTSLLAGVSSGIEPIYDFAFVRRDRTGEHTIYHPKYQEWKDQHPEEPMPEYFVTANDLTPEEHVRVQALIQQYTDASISKTVNAPNAHTVEDVKKLYMLAYDLGCKGVTYMRDGSRAGVLEHISDAKEEQETKVRARPASLKGTSYRVETPVGTAFIVINADQAGNPFEVFINVGHAGTDVMADAEALGRMISLTLRTSSDPKEACKQVIDQLHGIGGSGAVGFGVRKIRSLADAIAAVLRQHLEGDKAEKVAEAQEQPQPSLFEGKPKAKRDFCPECGSAALVHEEGCAKCYACAYARC
jgi:ribonucleoside-diphosphate reductase alpha chain